MPSSKLQVKRNNKKTKVETKVLRLVFRSNDRAIFDFAASGVKSVETRANTSKYSNIKAGDECQLVCGNKKVTFIIKKVKKFKSIVALFRVYPIKKVMPWVKTVKEAEAVYYSFPGYKEKIAEVGLVAFELTK